jgi:hypothetical protein
VVVAAGVPRRLAAGRRGQCCDLIVRQRELVPGLVKPVRQAAKSRLHTPVASARATALRLYPIRVPASTWVSRAC